MTAPATPPRLLTVPEAAQVLRISVRTLRSQIDAGRLPVVRVTPGRVAIQESDLVAYIAARREVAP